MKFFDPAQISQGVEACYSGPSPLVQEHAETAVLWAGDEPVPSRFHVIGKLTVAPGLLAQVNRAMAEEGVFVVDQECFGEELRYGNEIPPSPFLDYFFTTCVRRFEGVVQQDLEQIAETTEHRIKHALVAGSYGFHEEDGWHRDGLDFRDLTYRANIVGPVVEFATGSYRSSAFDAYFFQGRPLSQDVQASEVGDIIVHDATSTLSREPASQFNGYMRIDSCMVVHNVFN